MDNLIRKLTALGVPGLILLVLINVSGYAGGAAITSALAAFGPGGMVAGVFLFALIALIIDWLGKVGFEAIASGVVKDLYEKGETRETILQKVDDFGITLPGGKVLKIPLTKDIKRKVVETLDELLTEKTDKEGQDNTDGD